MFSTKDKSTKIVVRGVLILYMVVLFSKGVPAENAQPIQAQELE